MTTIEWSEGRTRKRPSAETFLHVDEVAKVIEALEVFEEADGPDGPYGVDAYAQLRRALFSSTDQGAGEDGKGGAGATEVKSDVRRTRKAA